MELTDSLRKKLNKDMKLGIHIFREPYFSYLIKLYNHTGIYNWYVNYVKRFNDRQEFYSYCDDIQNQILEIIKTSEEFIQFNKMDMNKYGVNMKDVKQLKTLYHKDNVGKLWISLDLIKANIQVLQKMNIIKEQSYEEFIKNIISDDYFIKSKQIREVLFGHTNPKRIATVMKYMIMELYNSLSEIEQIGCELFYTSEDELLIKVNNTYPINVENLLKSLHRILDGSKVRISPFYLRSLKTNLEEYFYKEDILGDIEFKGVPSYLLPQLTKLYRNEEITDMDLYFEHNDLLSKFEEKLYLI